MKHNLKERYYCMKIIRLLTLILIMATSLNRIDAQTTSVQLKKDIKVSNVTILQLMDKLGKDFKCSFFIVDEEIGKIIVSVDLKNVTVNEILESAFKGKDIDFVVKNKIITISKKNADPKPDKTPQPGNKIRRISGVVMDEKGQAIIGANIIIPGTTIGVATDINGHFTLEAPVINKLRISYIGYNTREEELLTTDTELKIMLDPTPQALKEVFVTAQAIGQKAAINQQLSSLTIKNVVSADRIRQIPDANAAEAIGRLPGVTVTRSGGEANGIVVRGMQGYNNVTVNGLDVPVNLTSISQYALQNVEVFKSVSADMDASAPAGTVNLKLGVAPDRNATSIMAQIGYSDLNKTYQNYKLNVSSSWRLYHKKLGISVNLSTEATDRSTEQLTADIGAGNQIITEGQAIKLQTNSVSLRNVDRVVKRNSAILTTDYRFSPEASIEWSNIFTHSPGGALNVDHHFSGGAGNSTYAINDNTANNNYNYSSILTAKHQLGKVKVDYSASIGYAHNYNESRNTSFLDLKSYKQTLTVNQMQTLSHQEYVGLAQMDNTPETMSRYKLTNSAQAQPGLDHSTSSSKNIDADVRINMELPFKIGNIISGKLKWGGRYKRQDYQQKTFGIKKESYYFPEILMGKTSVFREDGTRWNDDIHLTPNDYDINGQVLGTYLLDNSNYNNNFLNQGFNFGWYPNMSRTNELLDWYDNLTNYAYSRGQEYWQPIWGQIMQLQKENFNGNARGTKSHNLNHYAGYLMTELSIGEKVNFVPGVRYEKYHYDMNTWNIREEIISSLQLTGEPVNGTHDDQFFLPMVQFKYKPLSWLQGLVSYTETLKRPSVGQIEPYVNENKITLTYNAGNPNLRPEHWTSIDMGVAVHNKKIGLFSVNLFYKKVKDKIAVKNWTKMSIDKVTKLGSFQPDQRVDVTETLNHPYDGIAKGIELEWQTNFWYLPKPFSFFILNLNYSYINNKTTYVYAATRDSLIGYGRGNRPIYEKIQYDKLVVGPMTNQPSHLFNSSLGFTYKNFSTYISYQYIGEVFQQKAEIKELDSFKNAFHRIDLQANYKLPVKGMEILFNMANIGDAQEVKKRRGDDRPTSIERYGWTADFGLRYTF